MSLLFFFFFFQAEDGIRDYKVNGVQTCALPIWAAGNENVWYGNEPQGTSDGTGVFEIVGLRPGRVALQARHPDYASGSVSSLEVDPARGPTEARIVLSRGGRIVGWVRKRDGSPVTGMKISVGRSAGEPFFGGGGPPLAEPGPDGSYA